MGEVLGQWILFDLFAVEFMQAVDKLPLVPSVFEIVGILFSGVSS